MVGVVLADLAHDAESQRQLVGLAVLQNGKHGLGLRGLGACAEELLARGLDRGQAVLVEHQKVNPVVPVEGNQAHLAVLVRLHNVGEVDPQGEARVKRLHRWLGLQLRQQLPVVARELDP